MTTNVSKIDDERTPKEMKAVEKRRRYQRARYHKLKKAGQLKASKKVTAKTRKIIRERKRRGTTVAPGRDGRRRSRDERIEDLKDALVAKHTREATRIQAARVTEAIALLREANKCVCHSCGVVQRKRTKPELISALAQLELEQG